MKTLFLTGFLQVFLVTVQTIVLARNYAVAVPVVAFTISFVWTWNVKRVAFGSLLDRLVYSLGAACGATGGYYLLQLF